MRQLALLRYETFTIIVAMHAGHMHGHMHAQVRSMIISIHGTVTGRFLSLSVP